MSDPAPPGGEPEPSQEELVREMVRRLAETPVRDLLLQTLATFADMAGVRLGYGPGGREHRDLPQARLAIETLRALIGVAEAEIGAAQARPFREPLAQLQILYAQEVEADARPAPGEPDPKEPESRLWTPGGDAPGEGPLWTPPSTD